MPRKAGRSLRQTRGKSPEGPPELIVEDAAADHKLAEYQLWGRAHIVQSERCTGHICPQRSTPVYAEVLTEPAGAGIKGDMTGDLARGINGLGEGASRTPARGNT